MTTLAHPRPTLVRRVLDAITGVRADRWENNITGAGTWGRDKSTHTFMSPVCRLQWNQLESLYYGDWCSAKLVNAVPKEYFRTGFELEGNGVDALALEFKRLGLREKLRLAVTWARLWGGAGIVCAVDDGLTVDQPVNLDRARGVKFANVVDLRYLDPVEYYDDPTEDKFGEPRNFMVTPAFGQSLGARGLLIHESRIIRFQGSEVDPITSRRLAGWSYSALQRPYDVLRRIAQTFQAASQLMYDAGQAVIKIDNLFTQLAGPNQAAVLNRIAEADMARWSGKVIAVDKNGEDFERKGTPLAGVPDLMDRIILELSGASDAPLTRIFGRSPAGQNATGESDDRMWYEQIASDRVNKLDPAIERFLMFMTRGKWEGKIAWGGLQQPDDLKDAQVELARAQKWKAYFDMDALTGAQIALLEFRSKPVEEVVDEIALAAIVKAETELEEKTAGEEPEMPVVVAPPEKPAPPANALPPASAPSAPPALPPKKGDQKRTR